MMACASTKIREETYGFENDRFENDVDESFHCSICYNVLKEPRMCKNNEHIFCLACITQHLKVNSQTCPECNEHLSVDTFRRPRVLNNYLSKLKINCDYASRGCLKFICVGDLKTHVANCRFAPVLCSNKNCGVVIDKQEVTHHETVVCQYKKAKCHDCEEMQGVVKKLERRLTELDGKVEAENEEMKKNKYEIKQEQEEVKKEVKEVKKELKSVKENLSKLNDDMDQVKVIMNQLFERLLTNKPPAAPTDEISNTRREDILIAGGYGSLSKTGKNTIIYSWEKNGWFEVSQMNEKHITASSFIFNGLLFVVGGIGSKTIETLDLNILPLKWMKFIGELPYKCDDHQTVVYQQRVIHIGGYNYGQRRRSNIINELQLTSPCTMNKLREMPEPRVGHCAEVFEDKVLIFGGEDQRGALNSVLKLDLKKNECKEMPLLPLRLARMATVRWRDQVVVLGGRDEDGRVLNDVFMYDCKTGKITALPRMLERRYGCCAVISGNTIVVMGGENINANDKLEILNSVECFQMGGSAWNYLTAMNEGRWGAVAAVLPSTRKYV